MVTYYAGTPYQYTARVGKDQTQAFRFSGGTRF